ncbi:bifunctional phosphopantothenoylcysteine decarboxylase/phosphopantothenate--cysteine ligase CoaBC [Candidatus Endoriftia persephone]|jgi:phosphopantothenoylcysteine decarboxylase/phosphopantothenate--cysteine ligase|uniref:Coenzyme A biosynthesis bifunctional protein CoaBC n=3 Tax=Gammaproteobacteria TaxID=1236 RepID=G2FFG4_9GAMM|nr:bifunctional phosphopantothenoylcysteine decarboxylase/phosphopantothenate--cysteine ligase CoaBC [Candidatus Endoriftia persephone]EGV52067.1 coenzyme A biosynthesis bifunctional protein CoaBC [endosymbiont of Riftia pachyptila (vent Ph05)]EGW54380.1 coenzyme A biosynthesis bifunctional protein CoaBC [endosymbiont of Tevnia jerichonana (vent Tica)]USF87244.1 bifunctional phosphopantothenoylcysteine decarboxylase/phosphopantothenate--cysteine ligase CoaBC [Candidatus Endoriftia persephone]
MSALANQKILLGVTGGIAAYKSAMLLRALIEAGAEVRVAMTAAAQTFVTPLTFQALSGRPVHTELLDPAAEAAMGHIELARWADLILIAPVSADFMARLSVGMANDLLSAICLATTAPIALAPAMNRQMWLNPATQENVQRLTARGLLIWGPAEGVQACGESGPGRILEPEALLDQVSAHFVGGTLAGVKVVLTAGSTREPIDPVRFISNRSSGKMGFALAAALRRLGAEVVLVAGPVALATPAGVQRIDVETAQEMQLAVSEQLAGCDIFVGVAAVADYRPREMAQQKIKKQQTVMTLELERNPDILADVAAAEDPPFTVGFAAETQNVKAYAEEKRRAKRIDLIAANRVAAAEGGFERDENALTLLWEGGGESLPMMLKSELAARLAARIAERYHARTQQENS